MQLGVWSFSITLAVGTKLCIGLLPDPYFQQGSGKETTDLAAMFTIIFC